MKKCKKCGVILEAEKSIEQGFCYKCIPIGEVKEYTKARWFNAKTMESGDELSPQEEQEFISP